MAPEHMHALSECIHRLPFSMKRPIKNHMEPYRKPYAHIIFQVIHRLDNFVPRVVGGSDSCLVTSTSQFESLERTERAEGRIWNGV